MMIKYILKRTFILFICIILFLLLYIFKNCMNPMLVNAYYNNTNTIYSSSLSINKDMYYDINLLNSEYGSKYSGNSNTSCGITWSYDNNTNIYTFNGNLTGSNCWYINIDEIRIPNPTNNNIRWYLNYYYINGSVTSTNGNITLIRPFLLKDGGFNGSTNMNVNFDNYQSNNTVSINMNNYDYVNIALLSPIYTGNSGITFNNLQFKLLVTNSNQTNETINNNTPYSRPFKFGYKVTNTYENNFNINFIDNYNENNVYTLKNNSNTFIPFQYTENNLVTFSYNVEYQTTIDLTNILIKFVPYFSGTLKDNLNNNLLSDLNYVYNYIYYRNMKFSNLQDVNLSDMLELQYIENKYDNQVLTTSVYEPLNIISVYTSDIKQSNNIDQDLYFNGIDSLYSFNINTHMWTATIGLIYSINFDSIDLGVLNSMVSGGYKPSDGTSQEIYKACGNFFTDFNCYLGNGTTYVIYNIPILSPIFKFANSIRVGVTAFVDLLMQFQGFGIIFSIGIVGMLYCIIKKAYNKSDKE